MSGHKQNRTVIGTDRLQEIRARMDDSAPVTIAGPTPLVEAFQQKDADIAWLLQEVARLTLQERNMKRIHADLQSRYQIAASEKKRGYTMDVRMVNDGRTF